MSLRRKPAFRRDTDNGTVRPSIYVYPDQDVEEEFIVWNSINGLKLGENRHGYARQLVTIQDVQNMSVTRFHYLARIAHKNIARPIALYKYHIVYEFVDLDILDILPLTQSEIANVMAQAIAATHAAFKELSMFRINAIRISYLGIVKLDWNFEVCDNKSILRSNVPYLAQYLADAMDIMGRFIPGWDQNALSFREILRSGTIPEPEHPYFERGMKHSSLHRPALFAMRKASHVSIDA